MSTTSPPRDHREAQEPGRQAAQPRLGRVIAVALVLGLAVSAGLALYADLDALGAAFEGFRPAWFAAAAAAALAANAVKFARWHWYLRRVTVEGDRRIGLVESAAIFMSGVLMLLTPGQVGEWVKSYYAAARGGPAPARTAPIVVAERVTNMLGLVVVSMAGVLAYREAAWVVGVSLVLALAMLAAVKSRRVASIATDVIERLPLVRRVVPHVEDFTDAAGALLTWRSVPAMAAVAAVSWSFEALAYVAILRGFGIEATGSILNSATFTWATSTLAAGLLLTPGGLGVLEGGLTGLSLTLIEPLDRGTAAAAALVTRAATLWLPAAAGLAATLWLSRRLTRAGAEPGEADYASGANVPR